MHCRGSRNDHLAAGSILKVVFAMYKRTLVLIYKTKVFDLCSMVAMYLRDVVDFGSRIAGGASMELHKITSPHTYMSSRN
jgi:hypothetical protein